MQINRVASGQSAPAPYTFGRDVAASVAALYDTSGATRLDQQLDAYKGLANRWRQARGGERQLLAQVLTESPFASRAHGVLNSFTRGAWAGPDAVPPAPQAQALSAFDDLDEADRQIVAAMQMDPATGAAFPSAEAYRSHLQDALSGATPRGADTVTLSNEAQARLHGAPSKDVQDAAAANAADPQIAAALAAYAKARG